MYSSVALVRELSGLDNSTRISSARIVGKITVADSMINGALAYRYILPIAKHIQNTLTFTGTASASGNISITINSVVYSFAVTSGETANTLCDRFRETVATSDDFITDIVGSGTLVTLISKEDNTAQVNITTITSVAGVTITAGTRADRFPPSLMYLSADIATALLLQEEFGTEAEGTAKDGYARMEQCLGTLKMLQGIAQPTMRVFDEVTNLELPQAQEDNIRGYPNNSSNADRENDTMPYITMNGNL